MKNPDAAAVKSCQSILDNCVAISIPTHIRAGATTLGVISVSSGKNKVDNKNKIPVVIAVTPVLPPAATPLVDSI